MAALLGKIFTKKKKDASVAAKVSDSKKPVVVEEKEKVVAKKSEEKRTDDRAQKVLLRPLITEKATDASAFNKYEFVVANSATRTEVREAVKKIYGVAAIKVNIVRTLGKQVRHGRKFGKTKDWKKAIVTLAQGDKIEIYEGV